MDIGFDFDKSLSVAEWAKLKRQLYKSGISLFDYYDTCSAEQRSDIKEFERILSNRHHKNQRVQKHLLYMYDTKKYLYFLTFTFNDKYIDYSDRSQRDAIKSAIKEFDPDALFILNTDYGKENNRKHFHALMSSDLKFKEENMVFRDGKWRLTLNYNLGHVDIEEWHLLGKKDKYSDMLQRAKKYLNKLSNHCVKDTTRSTRIYYSFKSPFESNNYLYFNSLLYNGLITKDVYVRLINAYVDFNRNSI